MSKKTTRRRRRGAAILAVAAAVGLVVTGTLAWQSISQRAVNNTKGEPDETGARLHDDFLETQDFLSGGNKDVYVENYSGQRPGDDEHVGRPVYVRVRLQEYMELGEGAGLFTIDPTATDPALYQNLDQVGGNGEGRIEDTNNLAEPIVDSASSILNLNTWPIHIPGDSVENDGTDFHYYWEWDMGGSKVFMPTFNKDNESLLTDRTDNEHGEYAVGDKLTQNVTYADGTSQDEEHTAKSTLETADVITMEEWIADGSKSTDATGKGYWVGDVDGWFYWSKALMPTDATGLLLDGITLVNEPDEQWYYGIHVTSQMASSGDWGDKESGTGFYADGLTDNALNLLNRAAGREPTVSSITIDGEKKIFVKAGNAITLSANVNVKNGTGDSGETLVNWSIDPSHAYFVTVNQQTSKLTTLEEDAGSVFTVTATSPELKGGSKSAHVTVVVYPAEGEEVVGPQADGKYYVNYGDNTYREVSDEGIISDVMKSAGDDRIIGNGDDLSPVIIRDDGIKLLGPYEEGQYRIKGDNGKLGTSGSDGDKWVWPAGGDVENDILVDYNPDKETYQVKVDQVLGTGEGNHSASPFNTIKYTGTVSRLNETNGVQDADDQAIQWKLLGDYAEGTKLDVTDYTTGEVTLTIGSAELPGENVIILQATSREGQAVETVRISVTATLINTPIGSNFTDSSGLKWRVLAEEDGHKLIITEHVYEEAPYNIASEWSNYESSNLRDVMLTIYQTRVGGDVKKFAVPYSPNPLPDVRSNSTDSGWDRNEKGAAGLSHPGAGTAISDGSNSVFALSISEANTYLPSLVSRKATTEDGSSDLRWWLRSPGESETMNGVNVLGGTGSIVADNVDSGTTYARLAVWVKVS